MLDNDEIARQIAEQLYPEEALKARLAAFEEASRALRDAVRGAPECLLDSNVVDAVSALDGLLED